MKHETSLRLLFGAALIAGATAFAPRVYADDAARKDQARALALKGDEALDASDFSGAEADFRQALTLFDAPTLRVRLARALAGEGQLLAARTEYEAVIAADLGPKPPAPFVEAVAQAKDELAALEKRIPVFHVPRTAGAKGARVKVDGHDAALGSDVAVDPGKHTLAIEDAAPETLEVVEGTNVNVDLGEPEVVFPWRTTSAGVFVLASLATVGFGIGAGYGLDALNEKAGFDDSCAALNICSRGALRMRKSAETTNQIAIGAFIGGGIAALGAIVVFAVGKPLRPDVEVHAGPTSVTLTKHF